MKNEEPVKLGLMPPLTGLVEIYGPEIRWAGEIACREINEAGGVLGRPLELIIEDDGSLPESAVLAAEKLVEEHECAAIIGNLLSNSRIAVAYRVAEPKKIPYLNFSFYEGSILSRYFFHFAALPNQQIDKMIPSMKSRYGPKMFFAGNNYEWPRGSIDAAKKALLKAGGEIVGEHYLPIGASKYEIDALLDEVELSGADVFVPYFAGEDQVNLLTGFTEKGLKGKIAVVMGHYDEMMASHLSPEVRDGFYSSNTYFMQVGTEENCRYLGRLAGLPGVTGLWPEGNGILTNFGEGTYLCVKAFALAANRAGSLEAEELVNALETITLPGPQGEVTMDPATHHAKVNTYLSKCNSKGVFEIVESFGAIDPIMPERYRYMKLSGKMAVEEDVRLQAKMLESMTEGILLADAETGNILYTTPGFCKMFGYSSREIVGRHLSSLIAPFGGISAEEHADEIRKELLKQGHWEGQVENVRKDGTTFWVETAMTAFTHAEYGEVWMKVFRDISEKREAEGKIREFKSMADRMFDAFFLCDPASLKFTYTNKGAQEQVGFSGEELLEMTPMDINPEFDEKRFIDLLASLTADPEKEAIFETVHKHKNGTLVPVEITLQYIAPHGSPARFSAVARDIRERKKYEESLRIAKAQAERASASKSTFLATMSHEIRTPLNSILGLTEVLMEGSLDGEQRRLMQVVSSAGGNLLNLINDILDLSRIESGSFEIEETPFVLADQMEAAVSIVSFRAREKGISIEWSIDEGTPAEVLGDPARLRQVFINLLGNAVKFTEKGVVSMRGGLAGKDKGEALLSFSVSDKGIGIPRDKQEAIFEPFQQSDSTITRRYGGSGLGLTISKKLIALMGGEIWLESEEGKGSTFFFTARLPAYRPEKQPLALEGVRVLLFGENDGLRTHASAILAGEGAIIEEAGSGGKALEILASSIDKPFHMVVGHCDAELASGCAFGEKVRAMKSIRQPAILLSVEGTICQKIERGIAAGIRCGMLEPLCKKELLREAMEAMSEAGKIVNSPEDKSNGIDILLVDDAKDNRMLITTFLKKTPHRVASAENGLEAIEKIKAQTFDLVLMDVQMPEMDGYTATKEIRKWEKANGKKRTPILAFTAHAFKEDEEKSIEAGCDGHLTKPIKKATLLETLERYCTSK